LKKIFLLLFLTFFLFTCQKPVTINSVLPVDLIGKTQSELVTLTVACEQGDSEACDKVPDKKKELENLLSQPKVKPYQLKRDVLDQK